MVRFGIIGAGMIAQTTATAIKNVAGAEVSAIASRRASSAADFAAANDIEHVFETWQQLVASDVVDAVYVATPTSAREEITVAAAKHGKHILAEKPFASLASLKRIIAAAKENGVAFMDANQFTHSPRTHQIKETMAGQIGTLQAIRSSFFFPALDKSNIRFNPAKEPTGAVGDMGWYAMRAIAEYMTPETAPLEMKGHIVRDDESGAVIRGAGLVVFEGGRTSTFDFGFDVGTCLMDLDLMGETGTLQLSDFVLDWKNSFVTNQHKRPVNYIKRDKLQTPSEFTTIAADYNESQSMHMIRNFMALMRDPAGQDANDHARLSETTQQLLDLFWDAVN